MRKSLTAAIMIILLTVGVFGSNKLLSLNKEIALIQKENMQLRALKTHFYDFRKRVMHTIPVDYLSEVTIGDFDFDKYLEDE